MSRRLQTCAKIRALALLCVPLVVGAHTENIPCSDVCQPPACSLAIVSCGKADLDEWPPARCCTLTLLGAIACRHDLPSAGAREPEQYLASKQVLPQGPVM